MSCSVERYPGDEVGIYAHGDLAIGSVTFDQGVAVEVYREGAFVPVSARPTSLIEGRASYVRATWDVPEDWEAREIAAVLEIVQVGGEATSEVRRRWIEGPGDLRYPEGAFDWFVPGELMTPGSSWRVGFYEVEGARIDLLPPPAHVIPRTRGPTGVKIGRHEIELLVVPIDHQFSGPMDCEGPPQFDASRIAELYDYLARINPVDNVVINVRDTPLEWTESAGSLSKILDALSELREADGAPPYVYYYGAIDPCDWGSTAGFAGLARVPDEPTRAYAWKRVAVGDMRRPGHPSNETFVHEIGHTQGRRHVPCKGTEGNPVDDYPVELGKTGSYGFDHFRWALHPPSHADYMSYCDPTWVGAYGWNQVMPVIEKLTNWKEQDGATNDVGDGHTLMISLYPDGTSRWWVRRGPPTRAATMQAAWKTDGGELVHRALTVHQSTGETTHLEVPLDDARQIPRQLTLSAVGGDSDPTVSVGLHGRTLVAPDALLATVPPSRYSTI
ncbi:MAG: hypothetical protein ACPHRO_03355 [Nannocystaceae bacterium]